MSVWRRLQRVGKKAAKFEITASLHEVTIDCLQKYEPGRLVVVWTRRNRRYMSKPFECTPVNGLGLDSESTSPQTSSSTQQYRFIWPIPENIEFVTTLYRSEKAIQYEDKEWICQIEDIGTQNVPTGLLLSGPGSSTRRRVLATRQIDLAEYVSNLPTQSNLKVVMRLASKKLKSAVLLLTLNSVIVKEGDATDEDMISLASLMSLSRAGSFNVGSGATINDVTNGAGLLGSPNSRLYSSVRGTKGQQLALLNSSNFQLNLNKVTAKLKALETTNGYCNGDTSNADNAHDYVNNSDNVDSKDGLTSACDSINLDDTAKSPTFSRPKNDYGVSTQSAQDLLIWSQNVTASYPNVRITDLTTSFQNGLAFCAILHHYFPDKIDYESLSSCNSAENCRLSFEVASQLGISRLLDPSEVTSPNHPPDLLSMMTYLHQIRTVCLDRTMQLGAPPIHRSAPTTSSNTCQSTRGALKHGQNGVNFKDSSKICAIPNLAGRMSDVKEPNECAQDLPNNSEVRDTANLSKLSKPPSGFSHNKKHSANSQLGYDHMLDRARTLLHQSRINAPVAAKSNALPPLAQPLRKSNHSMSASLNAVPTAANDETCHFESKTHVDHSVNGNSKLVPTVKSGNFFSNLVRTLSADHRRKANRKLYRFNSDGTISVPSMERQEPASVDVSATSNHSLSSMFAPFRLTNKLFSGYGGQHSLERRQEVGQESSAGSGDHDNSSDYMKVRRLRLSQMNLFASGRGITSPLPAKQETFDTTIKKRHSSTCVFDSDYHMRDSVGTNYSYRYALIDESHSKSKCRPSNMGSNQSSTSTYIDHEQTRLEQDQKELDEKAAQLESRLRQEIAADLNSVKVDELLKQWFSLVNQKSALVRRGIQLSMMEKEDDLKIKMKMLQDELRQILSVEDCVKTDAVKHREDLLLRDLVNLVNERDDIIQELDVYEKALAEELELTASNSRVFLHNQRLIRKACVIQ